MEKQTAVEWLVQQLNEQIKKSAHNELGTIRTGDYRIGLSKAIDFCEQAKEMEKKQLFLASNTSAKDAYKAGQKTMNCGCYEISDATTYEEWLYEQFKSE